MSRTFERLSLDTKDLIPHMAAGTRIRWVL